MAMCANYPSTTEFVPNGENVEHQALSERAAARCMPGTPRNGASGPAGDLPNDLVLQALSDGAEVRIRVTGEIATHRAAETAATRRETTVAISRIDEQGALDRFRFAGTIVEFEILDGDVAVTLNDDAVDPVTLDLPNEIVLDALTAEADVRIKVNGKIAKDRVPGGTETICDGHVLMSRLTADDEPSIFRFSGDVVEFKVMRGDVEVSFTVAERES